MNDFPIEIKNFVDDSGKLKQLPSKRDARLKAMEYLASKFNAGVVYNEKQVNEILNNWHTFKDPAMLRRSLIEFKMMSRTPDGREYRKTE
jgi:hypothetical protein